MYLGVKWEDSRIRNMNQTVEDLQVMTMIMVKMLMRAMVMIRMMMLLMMKMLMMAMVMIRIIEINNHDYLHLQVLLCRALAFHSFPSCGSQTSRFTM